MALTVTPILGFTGTASAAHITIAEPIGPGNVCENAPTTEPFTDVSDSDPAADEIKCLVNTNPQITKGTTATTYEPNSSVSRRQMVLFLARVADLAEAKDAGNKINALPAGDGQTPFTDIANEIPEVKSAIDRLEEANVVEGVTATTFVPDTFVSRRQMAKFLVRLQRTLAGNNFAQPVSDDYFDDDNGDSAETEFNILADEGVFAGTSGRTVEPGKDITRRQMASVLTRKLEVFFEAGLINRLFDAPGQATATSRPELTSARIVSTTTTGQQTATNPAGTVVAYTFDESVTNAQAASFLVYTAGGTPTNGANAAISTGDNKTVNVLFPTFNTAALAGQLTTATVNLGAVTDTQGQQSPEGDAGIGSGGQSTLTAGTTSAPDLQSVGGFRGPLAAPAPAGTTAVDFVFDQNAFVQNTAGFELVSTDGRVAQCTGPATSSSGNTTPSGQNAVGGNGSTTITVTCPQFAAAGANPAATATAANTARGVVLANTVGTTPPTAPAVNGVDPAACGANNGAQNTTNRCNPMQASQTPDQASSDPDLVSATFVPATNTTSPDQVTYTFDENVQPVPAGNAALFAVYNNNGVEINGGAVGTPAPQTNGAQVAVFFPNGTLASAVGANVDAGAVTAVAGAVPQQNENDEVGVANATATTLTPGKTAGPDLTGVALSSTTSGFVTTFTATYTFDEALAGATAAGVAPQLFLHLADGARMACQAAGVTIGTGTNNLTTSQVSCNQYTFVDGVPDQSGTNTGNATPQQIGSAVLGTVDNLAGDAPPANGELQDNSGIDTPEGAEITTGRP